MIKTTLKWIGAFLVVSFTIQVGGAVIFGPEAKGVLQIIGILIAFSCATWFSTRHRTYELDNLPIEKSETASKLKVANDSLPPEGASTEPSKSKISFSKAIINLIIFFGLMFGVVAFLTYLAG